MATPGQACVARLQGLQLRYGKTLALDDVTLDLPAGRMVGLIGPDGVGKSSLLSLVAGARALGIIARHYQGIGSMRAFLHEQGVLAGAVERYTRE